MSSPFDIFGLGADPDKPDESPARKAQLASSRPLPKRFYDIVEIAQDDGFVLHLDGRPVRTPARAIVKVSKKAIADVLAAEWRAQEKVIDPKKMPLTRLLNSAIDGVSNTEELVREEIVRFSGTDLVCYRADDPERLVERQNSLWDPVINWAQETYSCRFVLAGGIMHVEQPDATKLAMEQAVNQYADPVRLAALHSMTTLLGSTLLALAVGAGFRTMQEAWDAAHLDEDWNIELWGTDVDAEARRAYRFEEMKAAAIVLTAT
ncbi:MAG: ATP12 family protein [Hyphomicrobiales bacterium]